MCEDPQLEGRWKSRIARDKLAFVVHRIFEQSYRDRRAPKAGDYVELGTEKLRKLIGANYTAHALRDLASLGVIEGLNSYCVGEYSRGYRIGAAWRKVAVETREIRNSSLARKLLAGDSAETTKAIGQDPVRRFVRESLGSLSVAAEVQETLATLTHLTPRQQAARHLAINEIACGRFWLRADKSARRIFHNVTQCPREIRQHLFIDGEPTAEVDIANAQPFMLLWLYPTGPHERERFAAVVSEGKFYETLFEALKVPERARWGRSLSAWDEPKSGARGHFKKHVLQHVLYSIPRTGKERSVKAAFGRLFPWLSGEITRRLFDAGGPSGFARLMQRNEADLMLDNVIPRIREELPGCKPISIHDGLLCQRRFAQAAAEIIAEEAERLYDVRPRVEINPHQEAS